MRKYEKIWTTIKDSKVGVTVDVRCHESSVRTVIQAVKKEKTIETAQKKALGMRFAGNLVIVQEVCKRSIEFVIIKFKLDWNGEKL